MPGGAGGLGVPLAIDWVRLAGVVPTSVSGRFLVRGLVFVPPVFGDEVLDKVMMTVVDGVWRVTQEGCGMRCLQLFARR